MNVYTVAKFIHILGALGFFVALGVEWLSLDNLRRAASLEQVRPWMRTAYGIRRLGFLSMLALLAAGFYMMAVARVGGDWLIVSFASLILLMALAVALTYRRVAAIRSALPDGQGPISSEVASRMHDPILWLSIRLRVSVAAGIVFLMTVKPGLTPSLLTMGLAILVGLVSGLVLRGPERIPAGQEQAG